MNPKYDVQYSKKKEKKNYIFDDNFVWSEEKTLDRTHHISLTYW